MPKVLSRKSIAQTRLFHVEEVDLEFDNGVKRTFECLKNNGLGAVTVLAIHEGHIMLVKEYGAALDEYCLGLPKGAVSKGETILDSANRELKEEVGLGTKNAQLMKQLYTSPSYSSNPLYYVLATDCYPEKLEGDEPEPLEVVRWPVENWQALLGEVKDIGSALAILMWAQNYA